MKNIKSKKEIPKNSRNPRNPKNPKKIDNKKLKLLDDELLNDLLSDDNKLDDNDKLKLSGDDTLKLLGDDTLKLLGDDKLKLLDDEFDKLSNKIIKIRKTKMNLLKNIPGLKLLNESQIEEYYNNIKNNFDDLNDDFNDLNDNEDPYEQINPFDSFNPFIQNGNGKQIKIVFEKQPIKSTTSTSTSKSENFEVIKGKNITFKDIGGYDLIKQELMQCADLLKNYDKYSKYNVRTPKGLILEGPPGNGKTLLVKTFCGEIDVPFIPVSGAQFQEKYVGVGASRVRELFTLAKENIPCVIFIDEIDAIGRQRSSDAESHNAERDTTLNELLVNLDGFKSSDGIFVIGATNRIDLLDSALTRPGRIDKKIFVDNPDKKTREAIIAIHLEGKPYQKNIKINHLVELTNGFSGAQIENFLNEAMLYALRNNREIIQLNDLEIIANRILVGWQSTENKLSDEMLFQVAVHEMGHALVGLFTNYKKLIKVTINLWSPKSLGFTLFEPDENDKNLITKEKLINELMVLLGGRIAEEIFFENKISSGASHDLEQTVTLAQNMIIKLGMGHKLVMPHLSEKYKEIIDKETDDLINEAYQKAKIILTNSKQLLKECAELLVIENELTYDIIQKKVKNKFNHLQ
jgi:cell division protease FtsH